LKRQIFSKRKTWNFYLWCYYVILQFATLCTVSSNDWMFCSAFSQ